MVVGIRGAIPDPMTIDFSTTEYEFSHGHAPRGRGSWAFEIPGGPGQFWTPGSTTYAEAKRLLKTHIASLNLTVSYMCLNVLP